MPNGRNSLLLFSKPHIPAVVPPSTLLTGLGAYWKLEEASGSRLDALGVCNLSPTNTPGGSTGIIGNATAFVGASSQYISVADNAALRSGRSFTLDGWVYVTTPATVQDVLSKGSTTAVGGYEYRLFISSSKLNWRVSNGTVAASLQFGNTLTANTWYYYNVYYDAVRNVIGGSVNNTVPTEVAATVGTWTTTGSFKLGASPVPSLYYSGSLDEVGFWGRLLTPTERGQRYNNGVGFTYPFVGSASSPANGVDGTFTYSSTIDSISNLYAECTYIEGATNKPLLIIMHSYGGGAVDFSAATRKRLALNGLFVVSVGMRGRNSATGSQDSGRRELYDIYDVIAYVASHFGTQADTSLIGIAGYSGGGGNALGCASKFPDTFALVTSHFGMSDYGHDVSTGWTGTNTTWMGGTPAAVPDNYYANYHLGAIAPNYTGGKLWLFHDTADSTVPVAQSQNVAAAMLSAGRTNYSTNYTSDADTVRWLHGLPDDVGSNLYQTEPNWAAPLGARAYSAWTVPAAGTIKVTGYIRTKLFTIWLGDGMSEAANVTYDTVANTYTVTPLTGSVVVAITQGAKSASQTISSTTTLTVV